MTPGVLVLVAVLLVYLALVYAQRIGRRRISADVESAFSAFLELLGKNDYLRDNEYEV